MTPKTAPTYVVPSIPGKFFIFLGWILLLLSLSPDSLGFPRSHYSFDAVAENKVELGNYHLGFSPYVGDGIWTRKGDLGTNAQPSNEVFIFGTALWLISNGRVLHSSNEGLSWIDVSPPNLADPLIETDITSYGGVNDPLVLFVRLRSLFESKIYASSNGGGSWTVVPNPPVSTYGIFGMTIGGNKALVVSASHPDDPLYYTIDGGLTWSVLAQKPSACQFLGRLWTTTMTSTSSQYLFTICDGSIYRLSGVGGVWTRTMNGINGNNIDTLSPARDGSRKIYATCNPEFGIVLHPRCGYRSSDAGESWQPIGGDGFDSSPRLILSDAGDANRAYLFTNLSVFKTEDGGSTWRPFGMGLPSGSTFFRGAAITNNGSRGNRPTIHRFDQSEAWSIYDSKGSGCTFTVSPPSPLNLGSGPSSQTISVETQSGCYWFEDSYLINDGFDWISHGGGPIFHRLGPGSVTLDVSYNPLLKSRTGMFRLLGSDYIINQSPAERICSIPPTTISFGQTIQGNITNSDCFYDGYYFDLYSFNAIQGQKIRVTMNSTSVNGLLILADSNETPIVLSDPFDSTPLEARIPEKTNYFTISQTGTYLLAAASFNGVFGVYSVNLMEDPATGCSFTIAPESTPAGPSGGSGSFNVNAEPGCSWTASSNNVPWLNTASFGQGNGTVNYTVSPNTGPAREAVITVRNRAFLVNQSSGCSFSVEPYGLSTTAGGGTFSVQVITSDMCEWQSGSFGNWIVPIGSAGGSGPGNVTLSVAPNPPGNPGRQNVLNIAGVPFAVSQSPSQLVTLSGRVTTANGRPISLVRINLADGSGNQRLVFSNPSGYFRFREVAEGATYVLSAAHKRHSFDSKNIVAGNNGYVLSVNSH